MTAHECEEYIEEPPQRKRYAFRKPERQRDFLRLKLTLPSERRTGKPPPDPLLVLCRLQVHRGSRCSTVTKIPDTTIWTPFSIPKSQVKQKYKQTTISGLQILEVSSLPLDNNNPGIFTDQTVGLTTCTVSLDPYNVFFFYYCIVIVADNPSRHCFTLNPFDSFLSLTTNFIHVFPVSE